MSLFATNRKTKKKYRRRKRKGHSERESQAYTSPRESEKLGSGYFKNDSVI
jgi:hypothetical protein